MIMPNSIFLANQSIICFFWPVSQSFPNFKNLKFCHSEWQFKVKIPQTVIKKWKLHWTAFQFVWIVRLTVWNNDNNSCKEQIIFSKVDFSYSCRSLDVFPCKCPRCRTIYLFLRLGHYDNVLKQVGIRVSAKNCNI